MATLTEMLEHTVDFAKRPTEAFRASAPFSALHAQLGPLTELPGTWVGQGFNLIALPNFANGNKPLPFRLKLTDTREMLTFTSIGGPIPNRGETQPDIFFVGVHYFQQVSDASNLSGLHLEPGMWLNVPPTLPGGKDASVVRLATIPHGDALLAQGALINLGRPIPNGPQIEAVDPIPFTLSPTGARVDDPNPAYTAPYHNPVDLPAGITPDVVLNPNQLLLNTIASQKSAGQKVIETTVLRVDANPLPGVALNGPLPPTDPPLPLGGITNIPFVNNNAKATTMSAIFWVEKVEDATGNVFMQLQYTQTVILDFIGIKWPHISVATLVKQ
jgi:hypothetical protein